MNAAHHLDRSQLYLGYVSGDGGAGDYQRAARAIHRAASHVATAAAVHTHQDSYSWRRMTTVLGGFVRGCQIGLSTPAHLPGGLPPARDACRGRGQRR